MTSLNAAKAGLLDRGLLHPGLVADITIFDPATVIDRATYLVHSLTAWASSMSGQWAARARLWAARLFPS